MPDRRVFDLTRAGCDRTHHHLARIYPDARFDGYSAIRNHLRGVAAQLFLHP
jgi:hypothetical protein